MSKAFVLHSGGIDSSTCLVLALKQFDKVISIGANYGQRHIQELLYAQKLCEHFSKKLKKPIERRVINISNIPRNMLTDADAQIPDKTYTDLPDGISPTYVPFRNGLILAQVASIAQAEKADAIFFGAHAEDAANWAYPDCTPEFIGAMTNAIFIGTYQQVRLHTPFMWCSKGDIVSIGHNLGIPYELTWSCYKGGDLHCGACPTCYARQQAFNEAMISDPTDYTS